MSIRYLYGDNIGSAELYAVAPTDDGGNPITLDQAVVIAARTSFAMGLGNAEKDARLIRYLLANGHWSPLENVHTWWRIKVPIMVARQLLRYRTAHVNEQSRRYDPVDTPDEFYVPSDHGWRLQDTANKQGSQGHLSADIGGFALTLALEDTVTQGFERYKDALALGVAREQARLFLPAFALYTRINFCVDLRNLLHIIEERTDPHAQYEIRALARAMWGMISERAPVTCGAWAEMKGYTEERLGR